MDKGACPDRRNHHLYTWCGTCGATGAWVPTRDGGGYRRTVEPRRPVEPESPAPARTTRARLVSRMEV